MKRTILNSLYVFKWPNEAYKFFCSSYSIVPIKHIIFFSSVTVSKNMVCLIGTFPPVDLHWFFEISIRTEKKFQLQLKIIFKIFHF